MCFLSLSCGVLDLSLDFFSVFRLIADLDRALFFDFTDLTQGSLAVAVLTLDLKVETL